MVVPQCTRIFLLIFFVSLLIMVGPLGGDEVFFVFERVELLPLGDAAD